MNIDTQLAQRAINGDDEAFLSIMQTFKIDLYKTALAYLGREEDALEAIQEVTYRAYRKIHTLREAQYVKTWLIRIMINYCNDQLKRNKRIVFGDEIFYIIGKTVDHTWLEIKDAMKSLDARSREILTLKYFHDLKIKEIADVMQRSEGTIKTWLNKALKLLRENLAGKDGNHNV